MTLCTGITVFVVGLLVAVVTNIPVWVFWGLARVWSGLPWSRPSKEVGVPPWITGTFERALAFGLFYLHLKTAYIVLGFWLGAKLAANWQRRSIAGLSAEKDREIRVKSSSPDVIALFSFALVATRWGIDKPFMALPEHDPQALCNLSNARHKAEDTTP